MRCALVLYAFDLLQLDGNDLRDLPRIERERKLLRLLGKSKRNAIQFNEHLKSDVSTAFSHICQSGLEGSRRRSERMRPIAPDRRERGLCRRTRRARRSLSGDGSCSSRDCLANRSR